MNEQKITNAGEAETALKVKLSKEGRLLDEWRIVFIKIEGDVGHQKWHFRVYDVRIHPVAPTKPYTVGEDGKIS